MPTSQNDLQTARELKKRLSKLSPLIDFRLFGSRARGDADEYSDMDIFMEFETVDRELGLIRGHRVHNNTGRTRFDRKLFYKIDSLITLQQWELI